MIFNLKLVAVNAFLILIVGANWGGINEIKKEEVLKSEDLVPVTELDSLIIAKGEKLFNKSLICYRCHGKRLATSYEEDDKRNLLNFSKRYGKEVDQVFFEIMKKGRIDKGMPKWNFLRKKQVEALRQYIYHNQ